MASSNSSSPFAQTLKAITEIKFSQLDRTRHNFNEHRAAALRIADDSSLASREKVYQLLRETRRASGKEPETRKLTWRDHMRVGNGDWEFEEMPTNFPELQRIEAAVQLSVHDSNVTDQELRGHVECLTAGFDFEQQKFVYAELFTKLLGEWLDSGVDEIKKAEEDTTPATSRAEMHEQRAKFEEYVFEAQQIDEEALNEYLETLFANTVQKRAALEDMRTEIHNAQATREPLDEHDVNKLIHGLIKSNLLSNDKQATLKEFQSNPVICRELSDVLNMHYSNMSTWAWPEDGVPLEMRRQLNEKYRVYMDEEILTALFIYSTGFMWATALKNAFNSFFRSPAWKRPIDEGLNKEEREKFEYYFGTPQQMIGKLHGGGSRMKTILERRREDQESKYFMPVLTAETLLPLKGASGDAAYQDDAAPSSKNLKQGLLLMMATEKALAVEMHGQHTTVCSDFKWFGPSLSHDAMITTLSFFGADEKWCKFFRTFLESPMRFTQDGPDAPVRTRKRGTPMSHALSCAFGETIMFCMDYAVNQSAPGVFLYRFHDDLWIWNHDQKLVVQAWEAMQEFSKVMGLEFNEEKTGSICVGAELDPRLPKGDIKWGFLKLSSSGNLEIDQTIVDRHIAELRQQLSSTNSVFSWVRVYNRYMHFFLGNFAQSARCFGTQHLKQIESTLRRIHLEVFPDTNGSAVEFLSSEITPKFGVKDIPHGWYFWPVKSGGLELLDPFIAITSCHNRALRRLPFENMQDEIEQLLESEEQRYDVVLQQHEDGTFIPAQASTVSPWASKPDFPTLEEFRKCRESRSGLWGKKYEQAQELHADYRLELPLSDAIKGELKKVEGELPFVKERGEVKDIYWQYVLAMWGKGMCKRWGGLRVIMPNMLPVGMLEVYRERRIAWDQ